VAGSGQPIVLLADRQTTGGYPKIATVISADLAALGRVPIGACIAFERVTVEAAKALRRAYVAELNGICARLVPLRREGEEVAPRLFDQNLISGVVDARAWTQ
jgi:allophanate hydrolase subunit 2